MTLQPLERVNGHLNLDLGRSSYHERTSPLTADSQSTDLVLLCVLSTKRRELAASYSAGL